MRHHFWSACLAATLIAGCGSTVKLDDVPVEDKSGTAVSQTAEKPAAASSSSGADAGATNRSGVAAVDLGSATQQAAGPAGLSCAHRLATLAPEPASTEPAGALRWQGVELGVAGRYLDLMDYLADLERELPGVRWGSLQVRNQGETTLLSVRLLVPGELK